MYAKSIPNDSGIRVSNVAFSLPFFVLFGLTSFYLIPLASDRQAIADCTVLQSQASSLPHFYITKDQQAECSSVRLAINAPVR